MAGMGLPERKVGNLFGENEGGNEKGSKLQQSRAFFTAEISRHVLKRSIIDSQEDGSPMES